MIKSCFKRYGAVELTARSAIKLWTLSVRAVRGQEVPNIICGRSRGMPNIGGRMPR